MTIIAYKNSEMASDGGMWNGGREVPCPFPKITRGKDGSLWALTGKACDSWFLREWVLAGMDASVPPVFEGKDDDTPSVILAKPDGTLWSARGSLRFCPTANRGCWGAEDAAHFCEGAMEAGLAAGEAVALTIKHHLYAAGDVQLERVGMSGEIADAVKKSLHQNAPVKFDGRLAYGT
jgi:hypothetical protein